MKLFNFIKNQEWSFKKIAKMLVVVGVIFAIFKGAYMAIILLPTSLIFLYTNIVDRVQNISHLPKPKIRISKEVYTGLIIAFGYLIIINHDPKLYETKKEDKKRDNYVMVNEPNYLEEVSSYYTEQETKYGDKFKTYYYGVYLNLPSDTKGIEQQIRNFLDTKIELAKEEEAVHVWVFTDKSVIPKSFEGDWATNKMQRKCYAHIVKLTNGNIVYSYDIFGEFKP